MKMHDIIVRPIITETSIKNAEKGKFTFQVAVSANKDMIKKAIENVFSVNVVSVATNIQKGRTKRIGSKRTEVTVSASKKAIVTLKKGQVIGIFGVGESEEVKK